MVPGKDRRDDSSLIGLYLSTPGSPELTSELAETE